MASLAVVFSVLTYSVAASETSNTQLGDPHGTAVINVIVEKTRNFSKIWNSGDLAGYIEEYEQRDDLGLYYSGGQTIGLEAIHQLYHGTWPTEAKMGKFDIHDVNVRVISPTVALAHGTFQHRFPDKTVDGNYTLVWTLNDNGEWKIAHEHSARIKVGPPSITE